MARKLAALAVFAGVLLALAPEAMAQYRGGVAPPEAATESGEAINQLYWVVTTIAAVVFVLVEAALLFFIFRFRRRPGVPADAEGPQIHGNTRLEVIWTVVPTIILIALAVFTIAKIPDVEASTGESARGDALHVVVDAHQFYWQYEYENGALSFDTLYVPVGRRVTLDLTSADVPHSWWVPELTGKRDALPGQVNLLSFRPEREGTFTNGKCGEFCGIQHAAMLTTVEVLSAEEFEEWLADNEAPDEVELGREEWEAACAKCHGPNGEGDIGPAVA
ncbi:MAG: cytochrome c oxidase subunit II, partial [Actinobacteria bacterium]|nr:cytochrome c oxidase subunit II [Actinomycetota bacterium]